MDFFPELFRATVDALADVPAKVLFTVGVHRDPAELGPLPSNVHVEQWVSQQAVLPHAAAVACHGGSGTTLGTLAQGVPIAVLPWFADQPHNADRVDALGAGLALHGGIDAVARLADALSTLLSEPSYRAAAGRVAAEIGALPPVDEAVEVLEGIAGYAPRTRAAA
jgi:MGT family glycosyltransferase